MIGSLERAIKRYSEAKIVTAEHRYDIAQMGAAIAFLRWADDHREQIRSVINGQGR